jgi:hypothetical protein
MNRNYWRYIMAAIVSLIISEVAVSWPRRPPNTYELYGASSSLPQQDTPIILTPKLLTGSFPNCADWMNTMESYFARTGFQPGFPIRTATTYVIVYSSVKDIDEAFQIFLTLTGDPPKFKSWRVETGSRCETTGSEDAWFYVLVPRNAITGTYVPDYNL